MTRRLFLQLCVTLAALLAMPPVLYAKRPQAQDAPVDKVYPLHYRRESGADILRKGFIYWLPLIKSAS